MSENNGTATTANTPPTDDTANRLDGFSASPAPADDDGLGEFERLRLSQDFAATANVKQVITRVTVGKPPKTAFVRVRSGEEWSFETMVYEDKEASETFIVDPTVAIELGELARPATLRLAIARRSPQPFLWRCYLPGADGRGNAWHESLIEASRIAESRWVRVVASMADGMYLTYEAAADLSDPEWPADLSMGDYLKLAFRDKFINSEDHPVLCRLRGEA